ncbi:MAG TPA: iron ABC transporter permease [Kiritimatiellia bacterium]|nr:iron ABC transporter permease [Kiritimatiellia bacterium]HMO99224.1 iron ABC transporter permease [Kiritimatiellia bacterium]HMP97488.1 iron ABC transporter permease [Kiritimatiellia bacterium]
MAAPLPVTAQERADMPPEQRRRAPPMLVALAALVGLAVLLPLIYLVVRAGQSGPAFWDILLRPRTLQVLWNSVVLTALVTASSTAIGLLLAWLTIRTDLPGRPFWAVATSLPLVLPSYVGAFALIGALGPRGMLQAALAPFGVERLPSLYGLPGAWLALTLFSYPYVLLTVRAGWRGLDPALEEVARSLGRTPGQIFREITWPHLKPSVLAGALLVALYTLSDFGAVSMLQYNSFTRAIFVLYRTSFDRSAPAVLALMLVALTLLILWVESRARGSARLYRAGVGAMRRAPRVRLGWRTAPALLACGMVTALGLVLPVAVVVYWWWQGWRAGESLWPGASMMWHSMQASLWAAGVTVAAALPVAWLAVRYPGRRARWIERAAYAGHALPSIMIALALVFWAARYAPLLYQSFALLIFAYACRFLPEGLGAVRASVQQLSPRYEEAARNLGRSRASVFGSITLPLLRPGLLTGFALVFMTTMKELPLTLLLSPTGFDTLATRVWSATEDALFAQAAAPALVLVALSGIMVGVILKQEEEDVYE